MPANPIPQTVSQEAREAAWPLWKWLYEHAYEQHFMEGDSDDRFIVQAFARFEADCAARFVERVEGLRKSEPLGVGYASVAGFNQALDEAITAIQEPRP